MRFLNAFVRIGASLAALVLLWAVLFGHDALRLHFITPAYAAPLPGHHAYHLSNAIVYVSDGELLFLRLFTYGAPVALVVLAMWAFSSLGRPAVPRRQPVFADNE